MISNKEDIKIADQLFLILLFELEEINQRLEEKRTTNNQF